MRKDSLWTDGKAYFQIGDQGRGQLQNLAGGPFGGGQADDSSAVRRPTMLI